MRPMRVLAGLAIAAAAGCAAHANPGAATGSPASSTSSVQSSIDSGIDPQVEQRLWAIADSAAKSDGGAVKVAEAVHSTHGPAVLLTSGGIIDDSQPVWLIQVEGASEFVCNSCSVPAGAAAPHGRFITVIVGATTYRGMDFGLDDTKADLTRLGSVVDLHG